MSRGLLCSGEQPRGRASGERLIKLGSPQQPRGRVEVDNCSENEFPLRRGLEVVTLRRGPEVVTLRRGPVAVTRVSGNFQSNGSRSLSHAALRAVSRVLNAPCRCASSTECCAVACGRLGLQAILVLFRVESGSCWWCVSSVPGAISLSVQC